MLQFLGRQSQMKQLSWSVISEFWCEAWEIGNFLASLSSRKTRNFRLHEKLQWESRSLAISSSSLISPNPCVLEIINGLLFLTGKLLNQANFRIWQIFSGKFSSSKLSQANFPVTILVSLFCIILWFLF